MRAVWVGVAGLALATPVFAQTPKPSVSAAQPSVTTAQPTVSSVDVPQVATIKNLLGDGFDIRTGFIDPNGGAYLVLQKATSAFLCHSNPNPTCEKLN